MHHKERKTAGELGEPEPGAWSLEHAAVYSLSSSVHSDLSQPGSISEEILRVENVIQADMIPPAENLMIN